MPPTSRPIDFPPPLIPITPATPGVETPPVPCKTDFYHCMELMIRRQQNKMLNIETELYGYHCCIFNPVFRETQYDEEAQDFDYPFVPDIEGKFLISGLIQYLSFGGKDTWSGQNIILHQPTPFTPVILEDAKIIVSDGDRHHEFKAKFLRKIIVQFTEIRAEFQLIPYN